MDLFHKQGSRITEYPFNICALISMAYKYIYGYKLAVACFTEKKSKINNFKNRIYNNTVSVHVVSYWNGACRSSTYCFIRHVIGHTLLALKLCVTLSSPSNQTCKTKKKKRTGVKLSYTFKCQWPMSQSMGLPKDSKYNQIFCFSLNLTKTDKFLLESAMLVRFPTPFAVWI